MDKKFCLLEIFYKNLRYQKKYWTFTESILLTMAPKSDKEKKVPGKKTPEESEKKASSKSKKQMDDYDDDDDLDEDDDVPSSKKKKSLVRSSYPSEKVSL